MNACKSSSRNIGEMNLKLVLKKTSPQVHMESELEILGVLGKLVKYIVHLFKRKKMKLKKTFFFTQSCPNCN
jgi:hypothetical protein